MCEVLDLVYMDQEALQMSLFTGMVHIYKRSKDQIEELHSAQGESLPIQSIKISQNRRALLVTIGSDVESDKLQRSFQQVIWTNSFHQKKKKES